MGCLYLGSIAINTATRSASSQASMDSAVQCVVCRSMDCYLIENVKNELSEWLTNGLDSAVRADVQANTGLFSDDQRCSKTVTKFRSHLFVFRLAEAAAEVADHILP